VKTFIVKIPEDVLKEAKECADMDDWPNADFIRRVLETMTVTLYPPGKEYSGIEVFELKELHQDVDSGCVYSIEDDEIVFEGAG